MTAINTPFRHGAPPKFRGHTTPELMEHLQNLERWAGDLNKKLQRWADLVQALEGNLSITAGQISDLTGWEYIGTSGAISGAATVEFTAFDSSKYIDYVFFLRGILPATDNDHLHFRTSTDGGSTFDSTAGDYKMASVGRDSNGNSLNHSNNNASRLIVTSPNTGSSYAVGSSAGEYGVFGLINIYDAHNTGSATHAEWKTHYQTAGGHFATYSGSGARLAADDVNATQFFFPSGNTQSGVIDIWGRLV